MTTYIEIAKKWWVGKDKTDNGKLKLPPVTPKAKKFLQCGCECYCSPLAYVCGNGIFVCDPHKGMCDHTGFSRYDRYNTLPDSNYKKSCEEFFYRKP